MKCQLLRLLLPLTALAGVLPAQIIVQNVDGPSVSGAGFYFGQAFTTPAGGPWVMTSFNYFSDAPAVTPTASGKLYVFTAPYTGTPAGLNASLPNLIGVSSGISSGSFIFSAPVHLAPNVTYHVYGDTSFVVSGNNAGVPGGFYYFASGFTIHFSAAPTAQLNYRVSGPLGVPIGTPALTAIGLLLAASGAMLAGRRRRAVV